MTGTTRPAASSSNRRCVRLRLGRRRDRDRHELIPGNLNYDRFDRDNLARWDVGRLLDLADTDAAAILAAKPSAPVDAQVTRADLEFARALAAMHTSDWTAAATAAVAGYRDMQRADAAVGVTPASQRLAQLEAQNGNGNGHPALVPREESVRPINPKAWQPWGSTNTPKNPPPGPTITIRSRPGDMSRVPARSDLRGLRRDRRRPCSA